MNLIRSIINERITHIEDLPLDDFIRAVETPCNTDDKFCLYITYHETGKFYIGKGLTQKIKSGKYKGSGVLLSKYFKKYPSIEWRSQVILTFTEEDLAYEAEAKYVNENMILNPNCLNLIVGGHGWSSAQITKENVKRWQDSVFREKMIKMKREHWLDEAFVEKIKAGASKFLRDKWADPVYAAKMTEISRETVKKTWKNPVFQREMSKCAWAKPEMLRIQKAKMSERWKNGPLRAQQKLGVQLAWSDPDKRKIMSKQRSDRIKSIKWMNRDGVKKQVHMDQVSEFELDGWKRGMKC